MSNQKGKPMLSLPSMDDFKPDKFIPSSFKSNSHSGGSGETSSEEFSSGTTVYKWKDEIGTWHYGDRPPTGSADVSTLQINSNTNIIQSLKVEPEEKKVHNKSDEKSSTAMTPMPKNGENFLTVERAFNALNDAKAVQGLMNDHNKQLKSMTSETSQ